MTLSLPVLAGPVSQRLFVRSEQRLLVITGVMGTRAWFYIQALTGRKGPSLEEKEKNHIPQSSALNSCLLPSSAIKGQRGSRR